MSVAILSDDAYQRSQATTFNHMLDLISSYDTRITMFEEEHCTEKHKWSVKLTNHSIIWSTERGANEFVLHVVKDTWNRRTKNTVPFFLRISPLALIKLLTEHDGGINHADVIMLLLRLPSLWMSNPRVPKYINTMEDVQTKALQAGLTLLDELLAAFANHSLLTTNSLPKDLPEWYGKPATDKT